MSSPNIKIQSLIRKFKNGAREELDKKKILNEYAYVFSIPEALTANILFKEKEIQKFEYDINQVNSNNHQQEIISVDFTPELVFPENADNIISDDIKDYLDDGYFQTIYGAEFCDIDWVIMTYCINRLYPNFATLEKVKLRSLHIGAPSYSELASINHFLFNSKIKTTYSNIEWEWLCTSTKGVSQRDKFDKIFEEKYKSQILQLFTPFLKNGVNYVINETGKILGKINFVCVNQESNLYDYICYALVSIKLLDNNGLVYMQFPIPAKWKKEHINAILLYSLLFQDLYLFKMNVGDDRMILIAKNKKRVNTESLYRKLLSLLEMDLDKYNLFNHESFDEYSDHGLSEIYKKIMNIKQNDVARCITFNDMKYEITKILEMNVSMFL